MGKQNNQLTVGILFHGDFPWNRGLSQLYSLLEHLDHKPVIFASKPEARFLDKNDYSQRVVHLTKSEGILQKLKTFPLPFNPFWKSWLLRKSKQWDIECLIVRETPLSLLALNVAQKLGVPAILDIRENLSATYEANRSKKIPLTASQQKGIVQSYESIVLPRYRHIFTVSPELAEWVSNFYKINPLKITPLGNYPDSDFIAQSLANLPACERKINNPIRLVFTGHISEDRGVQDILRSLPLVNKKNKCIFKIIGKGDYLSSLRELSCKLNLSESIEFLPLLPPDQLPEMLSRCDIGVCPYLLNEQTHQTIPGKLFEYMSVGLPVLTSARKSVVRIVNSEHCGIVYHSRNPQGIASAINSMINNPERMQQMGKQGRKAIFEKYSWKNNLSRIDNVLSNVIARGK